LPLVCSLIFTLCVFIIGGMPWFLLLRVTPSHRCEPIFPRSSSSFCLSCQGTASRGPSGALMGGLSSPPGAARAQRLGGQAAAGPGRLRPGHH
jgi:hypothetical protein